MTTVDLASVTTGWQLPLSTSAGATQMATDHWLFQQVIGGQFKTPILRFYQWETATLSLGRHQTLASMPASPSLASLPWVRRPTGGRAVLHQATGQSADLTYCIVARGLGTKRRPVYELLCRLLQQGFSRLGVELTLGSPHRQYAEKASCFRTSTSADLCWQGQKMIGSAQVWHRDTVLQHGTIVLYPNRSLWEAVMPGSSQTVIGLNEIVSCPISVSELVSVLSRAAAEQFNLDDWTERSPAECDWQAIRQQSAQFELTAPR